MRNEKKLFRTEDVEPASPPPSLSALSIRRTWQLVEYRIEIVFDSTIYCELPVDISLEAKFNLFLEISQWIYVFACSMQSARSWGQRDEDAKKGENGRELFINVKYFHISVHSMRVSRSLCTACEATAHRCANQKVIIYVCWLTTSTKEINKNHTSNLHTEHSRCAGWHTHMVYHRPYHHRQHPPIHETAREILENAGRAKNGGETTPWRSIHDRWLQRSISFHTISVLLSWYNNIMFNSVEQYIRKQDRRTQFRGRYMNQMRSASNSIVSQWK